MNALVIIKDGRPVTTSQIVAESFGKRHNNVIRDIDHIIASEAYQERCALNFEQTSVIVPMPNGGHREERIFEMDRQGFEILAMGFTGEKALRWKFKYSDAFAAMEKTLSPSEPSTNVLASQLAELLQGKVLVDFGTLEMFVNGLLAARNVLDGVDRIALQIEQQCGRPLVTHELLRP
ncbi:MAG: Rha family transcriptional regulator [Gammaproteobacteria bacterium]|nr:Rha family transcriptional regulator [Gammaproteobacteria bacterium]